MQIRIVSSEATLFAEKKPNQVTVGDPGDKKDRWTAKNLGWRKLGKEESRTEYNLRRNQKTSKIRVQY